MGHRLANGQEAMKHKSVPSLTYISELIRLAGYPSSYHCEIVIPGDPDSCDEVIEGYTADFITGRDHEYVLRMFGYPIRIDPNAYAMDIVPIQITATLPFDDIMII